MVKDNQPKLFEALDALPWAGVLVQHVMKDRDHGRDELRTIQVLPAPAGLFPYAAQAFLIERHVRNLDGSPRSAIAALGITSAPAERARPDRIAACVRGHWGIENKLHWVRSPGVPSLLRDVALECPTESFCNTSRECGACCRRCSEARPARTCNKCNTLRGDGEKLIKDLPVRTATMS